MAAGQGFGLYVQGVNLTASVAAESVRWTETAGESNATLEFDLDYQGNLNWMAGLSQDVELRRLSDSRRFFKGNLVNARRSHLAGPRTNIHCTVKSYDAWLDQLRLPRWISKRPNGTNMTTDREMVQNLTTAIKNSPPGNFAWDAINTYVNSTNASMPLVKLDQGGSARDILAAIAEAAATAADPTARRFYIDFDGHLHYFKGNESLTAPYRIGDANYPAVVKATSGLVSYWTLEEGSGTTHYDNQTNAAHLTRTNGSISTPGFVPNAFGNSVTLATNAYLSSSDADLHQADGPWSIEAWVLRTTTGSQQAIWSGGSTDVLLGFDASDHIRIQKEGTGDHFVSGATYTSTTNPIHIVVTRTGGAVTKVYVNGSDVTSAGTTTSRTFVSGAGAVNIGRKLSTTDQFLAAKIGHVSYYSAALSAATVLAHYNDGWTIVPDEFEFEEDINDSGVHAYVRGGNSAGTGWVSVPGNSNYQQTFILDRPQSTTASLKTAVATGFLKREARSIKSGYAQVTGWDGWRAGQTMTIDDDALSIGGTYTMGGSYEISQLETTANLGSGVMTYDIFFGALPWSGAFDVQRKKRR